MYAFARFIHHASRRCDWYWGVFPEVLARETLPTVTGGGRECLEINKVLFLLSRSRAKPRHRWIELSHLPSLAVIDNVTRLRLSRAWKTARGLISRSRCAKCYARRRFRQRKRETARGFSDWPHNGLRFIGKAGRFWKSRQSIYSDFHRFLEQRCLAVDPIRDRTDLKRVNGRAAASEDATETEWEREARRMRELLSRRCHVSAMRLRDRSIVERSRTIGEMNDYFQ